MHIVQICIWRMFNNGLPVGGRWAVGGRWGSGWGACHVDIQCATFVLCCMFLGARRSTCIFINNKPNYLYSVLSLSLSLFCAPYCGYIAYGPLYPVIFKPPYPNPSPSFSSLFHRLSACPVQFNYAELDK